jgi:hypothetical protein
MHDLKQRAASTIKTCLQIDYFEKEHSMQTFDLEMAAQVQGGGFWSFLKFDSGTNNGSRVDGKALGAGCGTVKSDAFIPDILFGIDISQACFEHDQSYSTCGFEKGKADANFLNNIMDDCGEQGGGMLTCNFISGIYYVSVAFLGDSAYKNAQTASCLPGD